MVPLPPAPSFVCCVQTLSIGRCVIAIFVPISTWVNGRQFYLYLLCWWPALGFELSIFARPFSGLFSELANYCKEGGRRGVELRSSRNNWILSSFLVAILENSFIDEMMRRPKVKLEDPNCNYVCKRLHWVLSKSPGVIVCRDKCVLLSASCVGLREGASHNINNVY